jgi:hypothetical protein
VAGPTGKTLSQKLGIKPGFRIFVSQASSPYHDMIGELPDAVTFVARAKAPLDMVHVFALRAAGLATSLWSFRAAIVSDGMIRVSWPRKAGGAATDLSDVVVRDNRAAARACRRQGLRYRRDLVRLEVCDFRRCSAARLDDLQRGRPRPSNAMVMGESGELAHGCRQRQQNRLASGPAEEESTGRKGTGDGEIHDR